ncbi:MAG: rod-binding protein [Fimbriimonadales bacterium]
MEVLGMQITPYSPAAISANVASITTARRRFADSPASIKPNPAEIGNDNVELPQPINVRTGNPASVTIPDEVMYPQPVSKSPLLATRPISPDSITPNGDVNILPWTGPTKGTNSPTNPTPPNPASLRNANATRAELAKLKEASKGIEAVLLKDLVSKMRSSANNPLFGSGFETAIHDDMLNEAIANKLADAGGIGVASTVYKNMEQVLLRRSAAAEYAKANPASIE